MATISQSPRSRFLLLPEAGGPARGAKRTVVRRYALTRLPAGRVAPPAKPAPRPAG